MTSDELLGNLFEQIADHIKAYFSKLSDDQLKWWFRPPEKRNHGFECWLGERIRHVRPDLVRSFCWRRGPDLILCDGTEIELKAASDCRPPYMAGTENSGWRKYLKRRDFAGCLFLGDGFLGDGSNERKIVEKIRCISKPDVELHKCRFIEDPSGHRWLLGLLLHTKRPRA